MSGLSLHDTVKVRNVAPAAHKYGTLKIFHGPAVQFEIPSGGEQYVPYYVAKNWFGDVRSSMTVSTHLENTDVGPRTAVIPTREFEVNRLHSHYGLHTGPTDRFIDSEVPQVELYDMDGNRIPTVLEDPEGLNVIEAKQSVSQMQTMLEEMAAMRAELNALKGNTEPAPEDEAPELAPIDDPDNAIDDLPIDDATP